MNKEKIGNEDIRLTIEKYINDGKLNRVVLRTNGNNYLLDLPINSLTARSFLTAAISVIKTFSLVLHNFNVAVVKFTTGNLL